MLQVVIHCADMWFKILEPEELLDVFNKVQYQHKHDIHLFFLYVAGK